MSVIHNVRPWGGSAADVVVRDGVIAEVRPAADGAAGEGLDGEGRLALPSFTDAHAHLDSNRLGLPFRPHSAGPTLPELIHNDLDNWRGAERSVADRATYALERTIAGGATRLRSHAQVDTHSGLERLEGVLAARERHAGRADVQVVAFPQVGIVRDKGTADLLAAALDAGADLIGGIDPCSLDRDPVQHLDTVFGLAERFGVPVDLHLHEPGDLGAFSLELILERVRATGMNGRVTVSHAFALATNPAPRVAALVEQIAELDVALTTIAPSGQRVLPHAQLLAAGVRVGLGQDGMRDYWSPYGDGDMLGRTWQLSFVNGLRDDRRIAECVAIATVGGRGVIGGRGVVGAEPDHPLGFAPGDPADLVLLDSEAVVAAVMDRPADRIVLHRGEVVARSGVVL